MKVKLGIAHARVMPFIAHVRVFGEINAHIPLNICAFSWDILQDRNKQDNQSALVV